MVLDASRDTDEFRLPVSAEGSGETCEASRYAEVRTAALASIAAHDPQTARAVEALCAVIRAEARAETVALLAEQARSAPVRRSRSDRPLKKDIVLRLLTRPEGCLYQDILDATNWPTANVHRWARAAGLTVRKERVGGNMHRYFAAPAEQSAAA